MNNRTERTTVWFDPIVLRRIDGWLEEAGCESRSEFLERAARLYMAQLASEDVAGYLDKTLVETLAEMLEASEKKLRTNIFRWCVELNMAVHVIAAHCREDEIERRALRARAVEEVKRTNGHIRFEDAVDAETGELIDGWDE